MDYTCTFQVYRSEAYQGIIFFTFSKNKPCIYLQGFKNTNQINFIVNTKSDYIIYETVIKVSSELIWLWLVIEPIDKEILSFQYKRKKQIFARVISVSRFR